MHAADVQNESCVIARAQDGDAAAMQWLITRHQPLLYALASRIRCMQLEREVLIQAGIIGLMQAVKRYQAGCGAKLITYAVPWILGEMKSALRRELSPCASISLEYEAEERGNRCLELCGEKDIDLRIMDLRAAIKKLEKEQQQLICLRYFRDKTQKETALLLKKSQAQISRMERQAMDKLHALLS